MWEFIIYFIILLVAVVMMPKPEIQEVTVEDFETATAKEGEVVIVIFGTRDVKSPTVTWYGDIKTIAIKSKGGKK